MRNFTLLSGILFLLQTATLFATTYTSVQDGEWNDPNTWSPAGVPDVETWPGDEVIILHTVTVDEKLKFKHGAGFTVKSSGHLNSDEDITIHHGTGNYKVEAGGIITCDKFEHKASGITVYIDGSLYSGQFKLKSNLTSKGQLAVEKLEITGSGYMNTNGGNITVTDKVKLSGSGSLIMTNTPTAIGDKFERSGGGSFSLTGSNFTVNEDMDLGNSGTVPFSGVTVMVGEDMEIRGGATLTIDNDAIVSVDGEIELNGSGSIQGINNGGTLIFSEFSINGGGSSVQCVGGNNDYGTGSAPASPFDLETCSSASLVPVELMYFTAIEKEEGVELRWATATEKDNDYFQIEQSTDGKNWNFVTEVSGQGDSDKETYYAFTDYTNYDTNLVYFRLSQVDFDGTTTNFEVVAVNLKLYTEEVNQTEVTIFPNPTTEYFNIATNNRETTPEITMVNVIGQQVPLAIFEKGNGYRVNIPSNLIAGTYFVQIKIGNEIITETVIVN